eukprot:7924159-Alexandrium_andersonii.AAC.1
MDAYTLHDELWRRGWTCEHVGRGTRAASLRPYAVGQSMLWYIRASASSLPRFYMVALLSAGAIIGSGHVQGIPHLLANTTYSELVATHRLPLPKRQAAE